MEMKIRRRANLSKLGLIQNYYHFQDYTTFVSKADILFSHRLSGIIQIDNNKL